ncbi:hypothetical protein OG369_42735 [Streptomyces sp. NBC_01221]|uniref:hypothetical protein n=1 Tax=Streptomyces sp. NBC_01221 TaxID=2903782 RepID=UPI002254BFF3|nr:hypothetical protein [Streptomyces sp. NBC_01221]MCX4792495.1 hypothetical protein [Streptomyces sp. NBC_01221]
MSAPSMADRPRRVHIAADGGAASVTVDGSDISESIQGYTLEHRAGQPPLLALYASPAAGTVFDGFAHVAVADVGQDDGQIVAAFLANMDPARLQAAALERDDLDGSRHELTRAMLQQLADWAQGRT